MTSICHLCGEPNRPGANFCRRCGQPLVPARRSFWSRHPWLAIGGGALVVLLLLVGVWLVLLRDSGLAVATPERATVTRASSTTTTVAIIEATEEGPVLVLTPSLGPAPTQGPLKIPGTDIQVPRLSEEEEIEIGQEIAREVEREYSVYHNPNQLERVKAVGHHIVPHCDRSHLTYHFALLDTDEINAFAIPGGLIYITRGMLDFVASDDELAGVIGHEIAHVARRHGAQAIEAIALVEAAVKVVAAQQPDLVDIYETEAGQIAAEMTTLIVFNGWSQQQEFEADEYGAIYMAHAGYEPEAVLALFRRMEAQFEPERTGPAERLLVTHPPFDERIRHVEETIVANDL